MPSNDILHVCISLTFPVGKWKLGQVVNAEEGHLLVGMKPRLKHKHLDLKSRAFPTPSGLELLWHALLPDFFLSRHMLLRGPEAQMSLFCDWQAQGSEPNRPQSCWRYLGTHQTTTETAPLGPLWDLGLAHSGALSGALPLPQAGFLWGPSAGPLQVPGFQFHLFCGQSMFPASYDFACFSEGPPFRCALRQVNSGEQPSLCGSLCQRGVGGREGGWERRTTTHSCYGNSCSSTFLFSQPTYQYGGELILGGVDTRLYSGQIVWAPVTRELYWQIGIQE